MPLPDGDVEISELEITLDLVPVDAVTNDLVTGPAKFSEEILDISPPAPGNPFFAGNTTDHLAAVSTGGAPADAVRLEHVHVVATFGEMQRRRESGETGTDDAHIRELITP